MRTALNRLAWVAAALALAVILFGAWVRASDAGLGCPDWPGCYGRLAWPGSGAEIASANSRWPDRPVETGKAAREMVHRYLAGTLGVLAVLVVVMAWRTRRRPGVPLGPALWLAPLILAQALLGMLTVTWLLKPAVVVAHLLGGLATFALLVWLALRSDPGLQPLARPPRFLRRWVVLALLVLVVQISLGGWTSANYAALACPDFPTCQTHWWPDMDLGEAFVPWRGIGVDYEGGVLEHPARVAVHFVHRLGAILTLGVLVGLALVLWRGGGVRLRSAAALLLVATVVQVGLGIANVVLGLPLWSAVAHNGSAALLVFLLVVVLHLLSPVTFAKNQAK